MNISIWTSILLRIANIPENGVVERTEEMGNLLVTVANVYPKDKSVSFHVTSFIRIVNDKIISLDEYWADDSDAPQWRLDKHIGTAIK